MTLKELEENQWLAEGLSATDAANQAFSDEQRELPWIAKLLMGAGGWLAAIFLGGFTALLFFEILDFNDEKGLVVIGLVYLAGAVLLSIKADHPFLNQLTLALGISGTVMIVVGFWDEGRGGKDGLHSFLATIAICPFVYWLTKNEILKFSSVLTIFIVWFLYQQEGFGRRESPNVLPAIEGVLLVLVLVSGVLKTRLWRPGLIGCIGGMFLFLFLFLNPEVNNKEDWQGVDPIWVSLVTAIGFPVVLGMLTRPQKTVAIGFLVFLAALIFGTCYFGGIGIGASIGLIAVGRARNDRMLERIGILGLGVFVIAFYYFLGESLLTKSYIMMATGVALLALSISSNYLFQSKTPITTAE